MRANLYSWALLAAAQTIYAQTATIIVEASHGGALSDLTNTTISVPIGKLYSGDPALETVSTLFLTAATGVSLDSITCSTYMSSNGSSPVGLAFNSTRPSLLSTNTVHIGAILCKARAGTSSSSASSSLGSVISSSTPTPIATTSYVVATETPSGGLSPTTITSVIVHTLSSASPSSSPGSSSTSPASSSSSPGLAGVNAASSVLPQEVVYHALAVVGLGIAFAL